MDPRLAGHAVMSQRYPSAAGDDYGYDSGHHVLPSTRQPLSESSGNSQPAAAAASSLASLTASYADRLANAAALHSSIPTPPTVPTQAFGCGSSSYDLPSNLRLRHRHQLSSQRRKAQQLQQQQQRGAINPIWLSQQFQNYRKKQAERDDKSDQKWPDVLEDAFLDALLLIPQMGRKKYTMHGTQHGRNMLISQYLWISYCQTLPAGIKPDPKMWRERKQVSSHIQVLKNFFTRHRCYHFFFPSKEKKEEKLGDGMEMESFKNNPVLMALASGRLPEERPNYEYFAQLLASDALVAVRPKRCWIFVSNPRLEMQRDGGSSGCAARHLDTAETLKKEAYPHLETNLSKERWPEDMRREHGVLLHEYTQLLDQRESSSVKELAQEWQEEFPELYEGLDISLQDHACDILHMHTVLQLQRQQALPRESDLKCWVEINIAQPALLSHRWKVVTRLARPKQLCRDRGESADDPPLYSATQEIEIHYTHRAGCVGASDPSNPSVPSCDCMNQRRQHVITVPFPAEPWARMLTNAASYPAHPHSQKATRARAATTTSTKKEEDSKAADTERLTQMDLIRRVAMVQELWSCPPGAGGPAHERVAWSRRSVLLWTFETVHRIGEKGKLVTVDAGRTHWRFLTAVDPTSQYHQQQALLSAADSAAATMGSSSLAREAVMSPSPDYHQHLSAAMSQNLHSAWDTSRLGGQHPAAALHMLNSFSSGLATPPPTASLASSFVHSLDAGGSEDGLSTHELNYMTTPGAPGVDTDVSLVTDPFLAAAAGVYTGPEDGDPRCDLTGWDDANSFTQHLDARLTGDGGHWSANSFEAGGAGVGHSITPMSEGVSMYHHPDAALDKDDEVDVAAAANWVSSMPVTMGLSAPTVPSSSSAVTADWTMSMPSVSSSMAPPLTATSAGDILPSSLVLAPQPQRTSLKRGRTDDGFDEDRENYPFLGGGGAGVSKRHSHHYHHHHAGEMAAAMEVAAWGHHQGAMANGSS